MPKRSFIGIALAFALVNAAGTIAQAQDPCANLCDAEWWKTASEKDVSAELARAADIEIPPNGWTPLHYALDAQAGKGAIAVLVDSGADVNAAVKRYLTTPLALAAYKHPHGVVEYLLDQGADHRALSNKSETMLHFAAANPDIRVAAKFLELGGPVSAADRHMRTPLHFAARSNPNPEVAGLLIEKGAPLEAEDEWKRTPWDVAVLNSNAGALALLTERGAKTNVDKVFIGGLMAMHHAVGPSLGDGIARLLIRHGADISSPDLTQGATPLHWASANPAATRLLISGGADIESRDKQRQTPLFWSAARADQDSAGALYPAHLDVMGALLDAGANVNAVDSRGRTPLLAALYGHAGRDALELLLEHGADPNISDQFGCTPLSAAAVAYANPGTVEALLVRHGARDSGSSGPEHDECPARMRSHG